jgi:hypothetical protein
MVASELRFHHTLSIPPAVGGPAVVRTFLCTFAVVIALAPFSRADEPSLKRYTPPADNKGDEPLAKKFSLENAVHFLDNAALQWTDKRG